jgi:DNA-binding MarR family transcriptional regulator
MAPVTHICTSALSPSLDRLVERGLLERAALGDGARDGLGRELVERAHAELSPPQAAALVALLGLRSAAPANDGA